MRFHTKGVGGLQRVRMFLSLISFQRQEETLSLFIIVRKCFGSWHTLRSHSRECLDFEKMSNIHIERQKDSHFQFDKPSWQKLSVSLQSWMMKGLLSCILSEENNRQKDVTPMIMNYTWSRRSLMSCLWPDYDFSGFQVKGVLLSSVARISISLDFLFQGREQTE